MGPQLLPSCWNYSICQPTLAVLRGDGLEPTASCILVKHFTDCAVLPALRSLMLCVCMGLKVNTVSCGSYGGQGTTFPFTMFEVGSLVALCVCDRLADR